MMADAGAKAAKVYRRFFVGLKPHASTQRPVAARKSQGCIRVPQSPEQGDEGYLLVGAVVTIFLVMLVLSVAAARVSKQLKREREVEAVNRGNQYVRAIRVFYRKNGSKYPSSIEQLENTNNQKFLRQKYLDPLTGKDDWRLIHVGENKTTVKGFFGTDLPGLVSGLGAAAGMASSMGTSTTGSSTAGNSIGSPTSSAFGGGVSNALAGGTGSGSTTTGSGTSGSTTSSSGSSAFGSSSIGAPTGGGGLIMGVGSSATGESIVDVNGEETYEGWEFLYDPRIEQLYAKASLFGGGVSSGAPSSGTLPAVPSGMPGAPGSTGTTTPPPTTTPGIIPPP